MDSPAASLPRPRPDLALLGLVGLVALINLPYFGSTFVPAHDAKHLLGVFSFNYQQFVAEHEFPRWMPYGTFGIKAAVVQFDVSATDYVFIVGGALFRVQDPLPLFILSMIGQQLILLLGVYLLSRRLFADRLTTVLVSIAAVCGTVWYWQPFFNLRWIHFLPLALYFVHRFTAERRPPFLWLSGVTLLLGTLGCPPYFYPFLGMTLLAFALALGATFRSALPCLLERTWRNGAGLGLLALTVTAVGLALHQPLDGIQVTSPQRDAATGNVPFWTFLRYGGIPSAKLLSSFLGTLPDFGGGADSEITHYLGLLPLAALPVALLRVRHPFLIALVVTAGLLLLMSLGGTFTALVYHFPLMSRFRHVGCATSIAKLMLLFAAGFGIDAMLTGTGIRRDRRARFAALGAVVLVLWIYLDLQIGVDELIGAVQAAARGQFGLERYAEPLHWVAVALLWLGTAAVALWPARGTGLESRFSRAVLRKALLGAVILDGLLYQATVHSQMPVRSGPIPYPAAGMAFHERRGEPSDPRVRETLREWKRIETGGALYHISACALFQLDPPEAIGRVDWISRPVAALRERRKDAVGPAMPKLRLVSRVVFADSESEAAEAVSGNSVVLRGVPMDRRVPSPGIPAGEIRVTGFSANRLDLDVRVDAPHPVWLVYADSFHRGWSATVNGKSAPVVEADLAFKGVRLEPGANAVRFAFHDGLRTVGAQLLTLLAFFSAASALGALAVRVIRGEPAPVGELPPPQSPAKQVESGPIDREGA